MNVEERIALLEQEIRRMAKETTDSQQNLLRLYDELRLLKTALNLSGPENGPISAAAGGQEAKNDNYSRDTGPVAPVHGGLEQFIGLKLIHLAGIIVLLTGISIGIKYAIDKDLISPVTRIMLAYLAGVVLFVISVRLKSKYSFFSAILFSGSMACCYFTTYGALVYYGFIPASVAFAIMAVLTVFTIVQSIYYTD